MLARLSRVAEWGWTLWRNQRGQDLVEYALLCGLVSLSAGAAMPTVADGITTVVSKVGSVITSAAGSSPGAAPAPPSAPPTAPPSAPSPQPRNHED